MPTMMGAVAAGALTPDPWAQKAERLLKAVEYGDRAAALRLIETARSDRRRRRLVDSAQNSDGMGPLLVAARAGRLDLVQILIGAGSDVEQRDSDPKRKAKAIHYAAWGGSFEVIDWLCRHTSSTLDEQDVVENTPLLYAVYGGHRGTIDALLARGRSLAETNAKQHSALLQAACGGHTVGLSRQPPRV